MVGSSIANLLAKKLPSLRVALIDSKDKPPSQPLPRNQRVPSPRSYALSPRSFEILGKDVQSRIPVGHYDSMQVWQDSSPASLTFTSSDLDSDPQNAKYLGGCCEDQSLVAALWEEIQGSTEIFLKTGLESVNIGDSSNLVTVKTKEGSRFETALLIGADGGRSWVREAAGISRIGGDYDQNALTFTVSLENSMDGRAFQRYLSDGGPLALLPTYCSNHAVVVWSTSKEKISQWKNASNEELVRHLNDCLLEGPQRLPPLMESYNSQLFNESNVLSNLVYGAERVLDTIHYGLAMASQHPKPLFRVPPKISTIVSPRFTFPLSCYNATTFAKGRVALVGDAAHTVHPMAGQGLNLGLGDVDELVSCIKKAHDSGMDLSSFLHEYNSRRHKDVSISIGGIHALQKLFQVRNVHLHHAKTFGFNMVQNIGPLRRQLASAAAYGVST